jgi:hypothetical protein
LELWFLGCRITFVLVAENGDAGEARLPQNLMRCFRASVTGLDW